MRDEAITCVFCRDIHLTLMFSSRLQDCEKDLLFTEGEVWRKAFSNKIIVKLVTQGLPSSFLSRPVGQVHYSK